MHASNVAPPQHSTLQNPALSMSSQAPTMSSMAIRVAIRLWCASLRASSVTPISRCVSTGLSMSRSEGGGPCDHQLADCRSGDHRPDALGRGYAPPSSDGPGEAQGLEEQDGNNHRGAQ